MPRKKKPTRRPRGILPQHLQFVRNKWRWVRPMTAGPNWFGGNFVHPDGSPMDKPDAIRACEQLNAAYFANRQGAEVFETFFPFYRPDGKPAVNGAAPHQARAIGNPEHTIGAMFDAWTRSEQWADLAEGSRDTYETNFRRLLAGLRGHAETPPRKAKDKTAFDVLNEEVRRRPIFFLRGETLKDGTKDHPLPIAIKRLYDHKPSVGLAARAVAQAWLTWCADPLCGKLDVSPDWANLKLDPLEGRKRGATLAEFDAMTAAAHALGYPDMADSLTFARETVWSQVDRFKLKWTDLTDPDANGLREPTKMFRQKTGGGGWIAWTPEAQAAVARIEARLTADGGALGEFVFTDAKGRPWRDGNNKVLYNRLYREIREEAAKTFPTLADMQEKDLRAMGIGEIIDANLPTAQGAAITGHAHPDNDAPKVWSANYDAGNQERVRQGAQSLGEYRESLRKRAGAG